MVGNEAGDSAASRLIQDATPAYLVKLMQAGTEYRLSDEQRRKAERIADEISRDGRISYVLQDYVDRLAQVPDLQDFATSIRGFFLNEASHAQDFKGEAGSVVQPVSGLDGRLKVGSVATVFIVIYGASVTLLSEVVGSVAPQADQTLRDILTLMPWAFSFPVAGLAALFFAKLLEPSRP